MSFVSIFSFKALTVIPFASNVFYSLFEGNESISNEERKYCSSFRIVRIQIEKIFL
jgi:hypothetical protein